MTRTRISLLSACALSAIGSFGMPAFAQDTTPAADAVGEIVVTAQKRSEKLSDVPMSISAATGEQLSERGIRSVADLSKLVPGLTFQPSDYGSPVYTIRGIGLKDLAVAVAPTVSVYVDQVPLPYSVMTPGASLDLERVEVLKGPQGTLFGQNSTGGAINYIAAKPTDTLKGGAELTYGRFDQFDAQAFVSGPLGANVRARLAVRTEQRGNWQKSQTRDDGLGRRNFTAGRLLVDLDPSDRLRIQINLNGWRNRSDSQAAQFMRFSPAVPAAGGAYTGLFPILTAYQAAPDKARIADWDPATSFKSDDRMGQASVRADLDLADDVTLTSISAYSDFKQRAPIDPDGTNVTDFRMTLNSRIESFSQELRIAGKSAGGTLRWLVGGNYAHDRTKDDQNGFTTGSSVGILGLTATNFFNSNHQRIRTLAGFASVDFDIAPTLTAQGSIRYTDSRNRFSGCVRDSGDGVMAGAFSVLSGTTIPPGGCVTLDDVGGTFRPGLVRDTLHEDNLSWRLSLNYKPSPDQLIYANITKGYKAGTFPTVAATLASQDVPVKQESVLAYELGFKASLLDRAVQLAGAGFYYDYKDKQQIGYVLTIFGPNPGEISIPKSRVYGGELNLTLRPMRGLTLNAGGTYVDSKVRDSYLSFDPFAVPVDLGGERFPNTPKWQLSLDADYQHRLSDSAVLRLGASYAYRSRSVAAFGASREFLLPSYGLLDLRAGVDFDRFTVQLWGRNITNKFYLTSVTHVVDTVARVTGMPVTYGATLGYKF